MDCEVGARVDKSHSLVRLPQMYGTGFMVKYDLDLEMRWRRRPRMRSQKSPSLAHSLPLRLLFSFYFVLRLYVPLLLLTEFGFHLVRAPLVLDCRATILF